jgi:hypothetical protein
MLRRGDHRDVEAMARRPMVPELPPRGKIRWTALRKAALVANIEAGQLSIEEACERYALSIEEVLSWQIRLAQHGVDALQVNKVKQHRLWLRRPS